MASLRDQLWAFRQKYLEPMVARSEYIFSKIWSSVFGVDQLTLVKRRDNLPRVLGDLGLNGIGVELGVFKGEFSHQILAASKMELLHSVDRWAGDRGHDDKQMQEAATLLAPFGRRSNLIRATFEEALDKFDDESLDFVYIDGYAHTGNEDGLTFSQWWPKIRVNGVISGHDYHPRFERNVRAVDDFARRIRQPLYLTTRDKYPSWFVRKVGDM